MAETNTVNAKAKKSRKFSVDFKPRLFSTLKNYNKQMFAKDAMAGVIVGIVAIPLAIAFGIASGVGPTEGLVTAIMAGFIISALGGSKVQIGGPTGAGEPQALLRAAMAAVRPAPEEHKGQGKPARDEAYKRPKPAQHQQDQLCYPLHQPDEQEREGLAEPVDDR